MTHYTKHRAGVRKPVLTTLKSQLTVSLYGSFCLLWAALLVGCGGQTSRPPAEPTPKITWQYLQSGQNVVVVRTGDREYVSISGVVFCWQGDKLVGVCNSRGNVWMVGGTNAAPPLP